MRTEVLLIVVAVGAGAGWIGALVGIGGGVFLVPFFVLVLGLPTKVAVATSLATVIATSCMVSGRTAGRRLINLRLGLVLEVATAAGGLMGGVTAQALPDQTLNALFGTVVAAIGVVTVTRAGRPEALQDPTFVTGRLGGRFVEAEVGGEVGYRIRRLPLALATSFVAGNVSTLLGIGGGIVKVPVLNAWCGVPFKAAAATSAFMIGVTAAAGVPIYYAEGHVLPDLAGAAVLGVLAGADLGVQMGTRARARWLKLLMAGVLVVVSVLMFARGR